MTESKITWTKVDEAPALASYALLPVVRAFVNGTYIRVEEADISLSGRIIANFPDRLSDGQKLPDQLARLGELAKTPEANIIKLPNISASIPQLQAALKELQDQGFDLPAFPEEPQSEAEKTLRARFGAVLGSAVNPVLREGNSDRRAAASVKQFAQKHPHKMMKPWPVSGSKTAVAHMREKDFFGTEKSVTVDKPCTVEIVFAAQDGTRKILKKSFPIEKGEVIDGAVMNAAALLSFYAEQIERAQANGLLLSLHLKATMMKISDPVMFGHCVRIFFKDALDKHGADLAAAGANVNNGLQDVLDKLARLSPDKQAEIRADFEAVYAKRPALAMVDSRNGITNLHVPNNIIVDASMPNVVRDGGKMWNKDNVLQDTLALIPDRSYAVIYQAIIEDCQRHGQFDPALMGSVSNVGLMAKKAEEYGSHDKTFEVEAEGRIWIIDDSGKILVEQQVAQGDIFRMCQTKDGPIRDWVKLAVDRARDAKTPAVFWLDARRGHDAEIIKKVETYLKEYDTDGLAIRILPPVEAMKVSLERIRRGQDTISVTGNVLRDYLTDLFPILELGTSARMLSIVPLMNGGGLFETGAGGSAPKHVQQFLQEGHLRWDSLGEYCALVPCFEFIAKRTGNKKAKVLADTLDAAVARYLENERSPSRKVNEPDNRTAAFYLTLYWADALAAQDDDAALKTRFEPVAKSLVAKEQTIIAELSAAEGKPQDIGGYYRPDPALADKAMRPSPTLNKIIDALR